MKKPRDNEIHIPVPVRRLFLLGLIPALLLGLWIGHLTAGAKDSSAPTFTTVELTAWHNPNTFSTFGSRWNPVTTELADVIAESGVRQATTRVWENCAIRLPKSMTKAATIVCPDGYTAHWG